MEGREYILQQPGHGTQDGIEVYTNEDNTKRGIIYRSLEECFIQKNNRNRIDNNE